MNKFKLCDDVSHPIPPPKKKEKKKSTPTRTRPPTLLIPLAVLPNIYKFPLTVLPENESYSVHGDDYTSICLEIFGGELIFL